MTSPLSNHALVFDPLCASRLSGICSATNEADSAPVGGGCDTYVADPAAEQGLLDLPMASYREAASAYQTELRERGVGALIERAESLGGVPDRDPVWLGFSPLGTHCREFMALFHNAEVRNYFEGCHPLNIACYGVGLHDEAEYVRYRYPDTGLGEFTAQLRDNLESYLKSILGPVGKCCHEPRELLLTFLRDERDGTIDVFDNMPGLDVELARPTLPLIDLFDFYYPADEPVDDIVKYYRYLSRGRHVAQGSRFVPPLGEIHHLNFGITPQEMDKIRHRHLDIALGRACNEPHYDLSVWLESEYFFDAPLRWIILSRIVRAMRPQSYLLTNTIRQGTDHKVLFEHIRSFALMFGLEFLGLQPHIMGIKGSASLYRRVSEQETPAVRGLADL